MPDDFRGVASALKRKAAEHIFVASDRFDGMATQFFLLACFSIFVSQKTVASGNLLVTNHLLELTSFSSQQTL